MKVGPIVPRPTAVGLVWFEPARVDMALHGDHGEALRRLAVEIPLAPRFLEACIDPPTRALFVGPSGTGKTLGARWLAWKLGLPLAVARLDSIVGPHLGESALRLRGVLDAATSCRSLLFLDEIDGISSNRTESNGSGCDEEMARSTAALLQMLDWTAKTQIVIAATNVVTKLDPALRRRLAPEVEFAPPCASTRETLLRGFLRKLPAALERVPELVDASEGMSGAAVRQLAMAVGRETILAELEGEEAEERGAA